MESRAMQRGVRQSASTMVTSRMLGVFRDRPETRQEFLSSINFHGSAHSGALSL